MSLSDKTVLVIGGGIAGVSAALNLAQAGAKVELVEKDDFLGGHAASLTCKATDQCQSCNACLSEPRLREVLQNPLIHIHRRSTVNRLQHRNRDFVVGISERPAYIDPRLCTDCGLCVERCPEEMALRHPLLAGDLPRLAVDPKHCLYFRDHKSTMCRDVCPEEAINFALEPKEHEISAQALVLATGFTPYPAEEKSRLGYGRIPDVVTGLELEKQLRDSGSPSRPSDGSLPRKIAFIQCVGSREVKGHNYCSRVCCGYALRLGRMLRHRFDAQISIFYMDLQSFGHAYDEFLAAARQELNLIRAMPYDVWAGGQGGVEIEYQANAGQETSREPFDLLVLSVGMAPGPDNPQLTELLGLECDRYGFLGQDAPGIFFAGAAVRPMDVAESIAQSDQAASQAIRYLEEA